MAKSLEPINNGRNKLANDALFIDAIFTSIGDGAIATDEHSRIVRINNTALNILGFKEKEVLGKWYPSVVVSVNEDGVETSLMERSITKAFILGKSITEKSYYLHKEGHKIPVSITVSPILVNGRPIGAINLFRDITQEYEIDRMKSEFISLASHQLRTPLSSIKAYSHMLKDGYMGALTAEQNFALQSIIEAGDRMDHLTETLLNIARIESGAMTISKKEVNLTSIAAKALKEQEIDAKSKNIKILLKAPESAIVNTDQFITKEIISNLLSNAIKYTPKDGQIKIVLKIKKDEVICSISDNGIGIPKQSQPQIFSKFYRAPNVANRDTTGTGLGLYLIKSLAEQINIPLWFESEDGKGSIFSFSLPLVPSKNGKIARKINNQKKIGKK